MNPSPTMLAIVTDAFGGRGGIAQYNRDFVGVLAGTRAVSSITVFPRQAPDPLVLPERIEQTPARPGWIGYSIAALRTALLRPVDLVFCGHLFIAPLEALITRLKGAKLIVQTHGIEAWPRPSRAHRAALEAADLVLCASRQTRHDRAIPAISNLVTKGDDICYLVVGEGADRIRLEVLARDAGVSERVRSFGRVGLQTLVEIYRVADLFVMPSTGGCFGVAFLEAMASGTPALGLGVAGASDALANGQLGTAVAEDELPDAFDRALAGARPELDALAREVCARFGRETFAAGGSTALNRLMEAA
jgi:phosphatidyl-myo-inositol dimannoside synthase